MERLSGGAADGVALVDAALREPASEEPWPPARTVDWDPSLVELTQSTRSRLPAAVAESWGRARQRANCGLFTEVQHAWVSVDSTLYLWDYCQENPAVLSVPADSAIISVAACAPRAGVFEGSLSSAA
ncbi:unnamed protein product, partial [Polarella glacialis]